MHRFAYKRYALTAFLIVLAATPEWFVATTAGPVLPDPGSVSGATKEQQEQLGLQVMAEVYKQMPVMPDSSPATQYIQRLGNRLVSVIPREYSWPYQFHVIPQREINAFALPGGPMFVNIGAITAADNEAQLAGVMSHEMAHVYMQHSIKRASKQNMTQGIVGILGSILGNGTLGTLGRMGMQIGAGTVLLKYSRGDETEADAVGAIIMYNAGYDPRALADYFEKLGQGGKGGPQFLSDHPNPGNRSAAIEKEASGWPPRKYRQNSPDFTEARQYASTTRVYTAQEIAEGARQGMWARQNIQTGATPAGVRGSIERSGGGGREVLSGAPQDVTPSGTFTQLQHRLFTIGYPANWRTFGDVNSNVTIAPPAGVSGNAIAYGAIIGVSQQLNAASLDEATEDLVRGLRQSNPNLTVAGNVQRIRVNGIEGRSVNLSSSSPVQRNGQPMTERDWLVTLPRSDGGLLYAVFIAPYSEFNRFRSTYERMLQTLQL